MGDSFCDSRASPALSRQAVVGEFQRSSVELWRVLSELTGSLTSALTVALPPCVTPCFSAACGWRRGSESSKIYRRCDSNMPDFIGETR